MSTMITEKNSLTRLEREFMVVGQMRKKMNGLELLFSEREDKLEDPAYYYKLPNLGYY